MKAFQKQPKEQTLKSILDDLQTVKNDCLSYKDWLSVGGNDWILDDNEHNFSAMGGLISDAIEFLQHYGTNDPAL